MNHRASDLVPDLVSDVVRGILTDDNALAEQAVAEIDALRPALTEERERLMRDVQTWVRREGLRNQRMAAGPRVSLGPAAQLSVFLSDGFTCRYEHCRKRVVYSPVLTALARKFPSVLGTRPQYWPKNSAGIQEHIVLWTCTQSLDHKVPVAAGGGSDVENMVTTCSACNFAKREYPIVENLWSVGAVPPRGNDWDGLSGHTDDLRKALGLRRGYPKGTMKNGLPRKGSLIRLKGHSGPYRVEGVAGQRVTLRMMWQFQGYWDIQTKRPPRLEDFSQIPSFEELFDVAPDPGGPVE